MKKILLMATVVFFSTLSFAQVQPALIKVSSFSEKSIDPNIMNVQIQAWAKASSAQAAQELAAKTQKNIKDQIEKFKIKKDDMQTMSFQVNPDYAYDQKSGVSRIQGYSANQTMMIVFKNIDQAGSFLDQISRSEKSDKTGISILSIQWDSDKKGQAENETVAAAVKSAKLRAEELAKAAQVKIKGVYQITHQQVHSNFESSGQEMAGNSRGMMKTMMASADVNSGTDLSPGKIKIRVDVSIDYYIQN